MRGDNVAAVTWVNKCGVERDKRARMLMRMPGRLEIKGGWIHVAKHIPGVKNVLADGILHWPLVELTEKVRELTNSTEWVEQDIGPRGRNICEVVLRTTNVLIRHDALLWDLMVNGRGTV